MKNKILLIIVGLFALILLSSFASALTADVAYVVSTPSDLKPEFLEAMNELGMSYFVVLANNITNQNFSNFKLILLNDDYFSNWQQIPINNVPAVLVNGRNMVNWGWVTRMTTVSQGDSPLQAILNKSYGLLTAGLNQTINVYTIPVEPDMYYIDSAYAYSGIEIVSSTASDSKDIVVGLARKGTNLTRTGRPNTIIRANTIFFGIKDTQYWTNETKLFFKNCLGYVAGQDSYTLNLNIGNNFVSIPLLISNLSVSSLIAGNPGIVSVKEYNGSVLVNSGNLTNGIGYVIEANALTSILFNGTNPRTTQALSLKRGMNLIGLNILSARSFSSLSVPLVAMEISKRSSNEVYNISTKYEGVWFNSFNLEPGKAYWVKASSDAVWSYNP